jgi:hypothetical protein
MELEGISELVECAKKQPQKCVWGACSVSVSVSPNGVEMWMPQYWYIGLVYPRIKPFHP